MVFRKFIFILIIMLLVGVIGFFVWQNYFTDQEDQTEVYKQVRSFLPFGQPERSDDTQTQNLRDNAGLEPQSVAPSNVKTGQIYQLSKTPVAGSVIFEDAGTSKARFVDRASGHIFESKLGETQINRISNTTIPKIYKAIWAPDGSRLVIQTLDQDLETVRTTGIVFERDISQFACEFNFTKDLSKGNTDEEIMQLQKLLNSQENTQITDFGTGSPGEETSYFGSLTEVSLKKFQKNNSVEETGTIDAPTREKLNEVCQKEGEPSDLELPFYTFSLPNNIESIAVSPDSEKIFYIVKNTGSGFLSNWSGETTKVFEHSVHAWNFDWLNNQEVVLSSKNNPDSNGISLKLNTESGNSEILMISDNGIITKSNNGKVLFKEFNTSNKAYLLDTETEEVLGQDNFIYPEKCVFGKNNLEYLYCAPQIEISADKIQKWHQGDTFLTNDYISVWDMQNRDWSKTTKLLFMEPDVVDIEVDPKGKWVIFKDKKDQSLWAVSLDN